MKHITSNLEKLRVSKGYTQEKFAKILCVARGTYSNYESGRINPPMYVLERISEHYGIEVDVIQKKRIMLQVVA
jgi:transcriptional regulator with XRE-family HTH domain